MTNELSLFQYFMDRVEQITEDWYQSLNTEEENGVYSSTSKETIELLKAQNKTFHLKFIKVFTEDKSTYYSEMKEWMNQIANDDGHLNTSSSSIINEFLRTQEQYLNILEDFSVENLNKLTTEEIKSLRNIILKTMRSIIVTFIDEFENKHREILSAQSEMIVELSAPVIQLSSKVGILPLIGEIDTYRASIIFEQVLNTCSEKKLTKLIIDISGVPIIDTMVASKLFDLLNGLRFLGVQSSLSGVRPEIAQTAVQLGVNLDKVKIYSSVDKAISTGLLN